MFLRVYQTYFLHFCPYCGKPAAEVAKEDGEKFEDTGL
jgi:hypothetical protein